MRRIYLDYNATTPLAPRVQEAMLPLMAEHFGNPSSDHAVGRAALEAVEDARWRVAQLIGAEASEILFTSGGTESNNLAIIGAVRAVAREHETKDSLCGDGRGHLIITTIEHPAVVEPARYLESRGFDLTIVPCDRNGVVQPDAVAGSLRDDTLLVSVMSANNEIGTIQPIRQIAELCRARGILFHTDAAQSAGKIPLLVDELGVVLLSIAGHKLYAPKGVGALYVGSGTRIEPVLRGAGQEFGLRPGTENVISIVALGHACSLAAESLSESSSRISALRDRLLARLRAEIGEQLSVNGEHAPRLPNTLSVNFPEVAGADLLRATPEICASTGAACHSGATKLSATLAAIGLDEMTARGAVRLSLGWYTREDDVDQAAELLIGSWEKLQAG